MAYIGLPPKANFTSGLLDRFTSTTGTTVTLTHDISSENDIVVFVNFVKQDSTTYSVGGTGNKTLTLGGTLVSSDIVEVHYLNIVGQTVAPSSGSVGSSQLTSGAVTGAKLNADVISSQTELATAPASTDELLISDAGVLKRIDVSLVGGDNTPSFYAYKNANQTITSGTTTKITFETELFDTNNAFASSKFTPAVAGKYYIETGLTMQGGTSELIESRIYIYKNGSNYSYGYGAHQNNYSNYEARTWSTIVDCDTDDYIEIYSNCSDSSGNPNILQHDPKGSWFLGYKLIGA